MTITFMRIIIFILLFFPSKILFAQISEGYYIGFEKKPLFSIEKKFQYKVHLQVNHDTAYVFKESFEIIDRDTLYPESDASYYYFGNFVMSNKSFKLILKLVNCDYCVKRMLNNQQNEESISKDSILTLNVRIGKNLIIDNILFKMQSPKKFPINLERFKNQKEKTIEIPDEIEIIDNKKE